MGTKSAKMTIAPIAELWMSRKTRSKVPDSNEDAALMTTGNSLTTSCICLINLLNWPTTWNKKHKLEALNVIVKSQHLKTGSCRFGNERGQAFIIRSSFTSWSFNFGVSSGKHYKFSCLPRKPSISPIFDVISWRYIDAAPTKLLIRLRTFEICIL